MIRILINYWPFLGAFTKLQKAATSIIMSACPRGTTQIPLDGFS